MTTVSNVEIVKINELNENLVRNPNALLAFYNPDTGETQSIKASVLTGGEGVDITWKNTTTYSEDEVVEFQDKLWKSRIDANLNNPPSEGAIWTEVSKSEGDGTIGYWSAGVYTVSPTTVINNNSLYILNDTVAMPYESTDFDAEYAAGDWLSGGSNLFNTIKLSPNYIPPSTAEGEFFWNGNWHTIEYDTGLGATIRIGQTVYDVFYNNSGAEIPALRAVHLVSASLFNGELYPVFELADASDYEKIQGTINITCCAVPNGQLGICVRDATKVSGDTSAWPAGSQLWVSDDGTGQLTATKPLFPSVGVSVGGNYNQDVNGEIFVNITTTFNDIYNEAWDGSIIESFDFVVDSDGTTVTGTLTNINPLLNLTLNFSDGTYRLDTTTSPLTIELTPGTDALEATNYVYIPITTKTLTVSTSGWPTTEHVRIARVELQSAATTQADGGALGNQNINDHIKKEDDNGHILHIAAWIRKQFSTWEAGTEATFDNTGGLGYILISGGIANQLHEQSLPAFNMLAGDQARVWNDFSGNRPKISTLSAITSYSTGTVWNNKWGKIVVWRGVNKSGEYSPVMINLPSNGYNSESAALADLSNYADYTIPNNFKTKAILVAAFTFRVSGGVITYVSGYEDLRGTIPITTAGGGIGGGSGVTTYLALTDTPSTRVGKAGNTVVVNAGELADEYEPKGWLWNAARTFYSNITSLASQARSILLPDKSGTVALLDDTITPLPPNDVFEYTVHGQEYYKSKIWSTASDRIITINNTDTAADIIAKLDEYPDDLNGVKLIVTLPAGLTQSSAFPTTTNIYGLDLRRFNNGYIQFKSTSSSTPATWLDTNTDNTATSFITTGGHCTVEFNNIILEKNAASSESSIIRAQGLGSYDTILNNCGLKCGQGVGYGFIYVNKGRVILKDVIYSTLIVGETEALIAGGDTSFIVDMYNCSNGTNGLQYLYANGVGNARGRINYQNSELPLNLSPYINFKNVTFNEYPIGGGSETKTTDNTEPYDGADGYLANSYVSYINASSPDPLFQINYLYLSRLDIAAGISPEDDLYDATTNPTGKWERIGESIEIVADTSSCYVTNITELKAVINYKNGHDVIVRSKGSIYTFNESSETGIKPNDGGAGSWVFARHISLSQLIKIYTSVNDDSISYWETGKSVLVTKLNENIDIEDPETGDVINFSLNISSPALVTRTGTGLLEADFTIDYLGGGGQSEYDSYTITPAANVLTVTFDADKMSVDYQITDAFEIQRAVTGNLRGKIVHLIVTADGNIAHKPAFSTDFSLDSDNWNNTNGVKNIITMKYLNSTSKAIIKFSEL